MLQNSESAPKRANQGAVAVQRLNYTLGQFGPRRCARKALSSVLEVPHEPRRQSVAPQKALCRADARGSRRPAHADPGGVDWRRRAKKWMQWWWEPSLQIKSLMAVRE